MSRARRSNVSSRPKAEPPRATPPIIRQGGPDDIAGVGALFFALWPGSPQEDHEADAALVLTGEPPSTLPLVIFVAEVDGVIVGFVEVGLRSHADGCDTRQPVGFLEGWYVDPALQRRGIGRALVTSAEAWCRAQGCTEIASDTWLDETVSELAHAALGFEEVDRCVHFRKSLI